ncbi:MAG: FAD-dependent oxidoreductase [Oscillospiraceae bacterium]|nr:FAD-dependent oxidoreductase [Oscillospiraceae bacterium]
MNQVIVIGCGPAGVSAALYTKRAGLATTIIGSNKTALFKAEKIENYYGFKEPVNGVQLFKEGIDQAKRLGCNVIEDEVISIANESNFKVKTATNGEFIGAAVILATGKQRFTPNIAGLREFEGRGVSYCAICDAFFYRNKKVAVIGNGAYAVSEAEELKAVADVTILTNGTASEEVKLSGIPYLDLEIENIYGEAKVNGIGFKDGQTLTVSGVFVAIGSASSIDFAKKLGLFVENNRIIVDAKQQTNYPGIFAAGDCCAALSQVCVAVAQGAVAGLSAVEFIRSKP